METSKEDPNKKEECCQESCCGSSGGCRCCGGKIAKILVLLLVGGVIGYFAGRNCAMRRMLCHSSAPLSAPMAPPPDAPAK